MHPTDPSPSDLSLPWHALLAPLPPETEPRRQPVAPPDILATPEGAAIAGWESLLVELSAGAAGLRVIQVTLDESGQPTSASDMVLYRIESTDPSTPARYLTESIGGRLEANGTFHGTRWRTVAEEQAAGEDSLLELVPSAPSDAEIARLRTLVADVLRRGSVGTRRA